MTAAGQVLLALTFSFASAAKLARRDVFVDDISRLAPSLSRRTAQLAAAMVLALEVSVAATLWSGALVRVACVASAVLLLVFLVSILVAARRDEPFRCGCLGEEHESSGPSAAASRNVILALTAAVSFGNPAPWYADSVSEVIGAVLTAAGGLLLWLTVGMLRSGVWSG